MKAPDYLQAVCRENFEQLALELYFRQVQEVPIYRAFVELLAKPNPKTLLEIPFLPISFFKSHAVRSEKGQVQKVFLSSGTQAQGRSKHEVTDLSWYDTSLSLGFRHFFGAPTNYVFIALLPSYLENGDSSLVYMVDQLIAQSQSHLSGFILQDPTQVQFRYQEALQAGKKPFIIGVSYALLDLAAQSLDLHEAIIVETGGMKGRRAELTKTELHARLKQGLNVAHISSEYGMTELLSQGYSLQDERFETVPWMRVMIRDVYDPLHYVPMGQKGGVNVIDLANQNSCAFIQTQDLGRLSATGFYLEGRIETADIRGCNLLVD
ncbi:MAG: hypothetical protein RLZZ301_897 [Bacteroidota bacterium]|jgi:hypothetical protein